ncbi:hypothetical protein TNCV_2382161 [Trichonephila clavipes]|nr:hypothetical protein TNCV_2382161 [Trichonephila clavipes]
MDNRKRTHGYGLNRLAQTNTNSSTSFGIRAVSELQEVEETINLAVSDLASFPPCVSPGCPHHDSGLKIITPKNSPDVHSY